MSKVLVDRELLELLQERLDPHRDAATWGALCDALRRAQPAEAEGVVAGSKRLIEILAALAMRKAIRPLHDLCEQQKQVSTARLEQVVDFVGDDLAGCALNLRIEFDKLHAALSAVTAERDKSISLTADYIAMLGEAGLQIDELTAERDRLREALGDKALCAAYAERQKLLAEVESMRKVIRAALYYVPEHKHDLREIMSAAMAAKEA